MKYKKKCLPVEPNMALLQTGRCVSACVHASVLNRSAFLKKQVYLTEV